MERAVQTEIDAKSRMKKILKKGVGKLGWFILKDRNLNIPTTWRWARGDKLMGKEGKDLSVLWQNNMGVFRAKATVWSLCES